MEEHKIVNCESDLLPSGKVVSRVSLFIDGTDRLAEGKKM